MREIYNRDPSDVKYKSGLVEVTDPVEIAIGQLKMLLLTNPGEVLGDPKFGIGLENLIFDLGLSEKSIKERININIINYAPLFYDIGGYFEVSFYLGENRDIAVFDFYIPVNSEGLPIITLKVS